MKTIFIVKHRRRREKKTDYKKRLALLKSENDRIAIRKSNKYFNIQIIKIENGIDKTIKSMNSKVLSRYGWLVEKNMPTAYLLGYLFGKNTKSDEEFILDFGRQTIMPKSKVYAIVKGLIDAGLKVKASEDIFPDEDRIKGRNIEEYAKKMEENQLSKKFSQYLKKNINPKILTEKFDETKSKINKEFNGEKQ